MNECQIRKIYFECNSSKSNVGLNRLTIILYINRLFLKGFTSTVVLTLKSGVKLGTVCSDGRCRRIKWSVKMEKLSRTTTRAVSSSGSHIVLSGFAPRRPPQRLCTPQTKVRTQAEKKYQGTKALYVMLSSCIDFFVYLTDNIKSLLHVMSSWAPEIASAPPVSINSLVQAFFGRDVVERHRL